MFIRSEFAQLEGFIPDSSSIFIVDTIWVQGNKITDEDIILRELTFMKGDTLTLKLLEYNRERIYSLGLFTKVDLLPYHSYSNNILLIYVEESWYIYPIPTASLRDNDWNKLSYGINLIVKNFRGRNETIITTLELGYDPSFRVMYYKPNIIPGSDIFWGIDLLYTSITNKSKSAYQLYGGDFSQKFFIAGLEVGKRFGTFQRLSGKLNYNYIESPVFISSVNASNSRIDRYPSINFLYSYDTRDLAQFPKEGILGTANVEFKGLGVNNINYQIFGIDFREYRKLIDDLTTKWRLAARFSSGKTIPFYDYSIIGYNEKIRGYYSRVLEGNNYFLGSLELLYPLIKDFNITFDFIPVLPRELLSYRIGLYLELFGDTGAAKILGKPLRSTDFESGYGFGFSMLFLPYNILRFEIAFDEYKNSEFILGLGLSF